MSEFRKKLAQAFAALEGQGVVSRANYACCQSCAGYAITQEIVGMIKAGRDRGSVKGVVYWHEQDDDNLDDSGGTYLSFGPVSSSELGMIGLPDVEVGSLVVAALEAAGLHVVWPVDGAIRIWVQEAPVAEEVLS